MNSSQKRVLLILALMGLAYFAVFIFPNVKGAANANMLSVFETDEYAQYPHVIRMLTPGATFYESIRNFTVYLHYYYGYPFYFFSALAILPIRVLGGAGWANQTTWIVLFLRQLINVLPMIVSVLLLVWIQTRFRRAWLAVALFLFLLAVPALVVNNFWWHPDSLLVLFVVLTIFFLDRDDLRFGRNFFLAAVACGLATGTKNLGLFFVLTVPVYLAWGVWKKKINLGRAAVLGGLFVLVMVASIIISNPLLLLPQERAAIIATQKLQWQQSTQGYWTFNLNPYFQWGQYPEDFRQHYGELFFLLLTLVSLALGLWRKESRLLHVLILTWIIPFSYYFLVIATTRRTHYFLPAALPLFSCLVAFAMPSLPELPGQLGRLRVRLSNQIGNIARWAVVMLIVVQSGLFLYKDGQLFIQQMNREKTSSSLAFYQKLDQQVFSGLDGQHLTIYYDWKVYLPPHTGWREEMNWDLANYIYIDKLNPDVILLEQDNILLFSSPDVMKNAINPGNAAAQHQFYSDAEQDKLKGYRLVLKDKFALAFVREGLVIK